MPKQISTFKVQLILVFIEANGFEILGDKRSHFEDGQICHEDIEQSTEQAAICETRVDTFNNNSEQQGNSERGKKSFTPKSLK